MNILQTFASNMRKFRKAAHLSQEQLAERAGLHRTYIGGIEQRRINVSLKNVAKIAAALDLDPAELFIPEAIDPDGWDVRAEGEQAAREKAQRSREPARLEAGGGDGESACSYAICEWHGDDVAFHPVEVTFEDVSIQILCFLVERGYEGDELAEQYGRMNREIIEFLEKQGFDRAMVNREKLLAHESVPDSGDSSM